MREQYHGRQQNENNEDAHDGLDEGGQLALAAIFVVFLGSCMKDGAQDDHRHHVEEQDAQEHFTVVRHLSILQDYFAVAGLPEKQMAQLCASDQHHRNAYFPPAIVLRFRRGTTGGRAGLVE